MAKPKKTGSRHGPRSMISLPPELYAQLKILAKKNNRPTNWEARQHIEEALKVAGLWPPPDGKPAKP